MEALYNYRYSEENLSIKLHENKLLLELLEEFDDDKYNELLTCRKYRSVKFPYEFSYECCGEEIEGSANYVEWQVLKQLDKQASDELVDDMKKAMLLPQSLFPIRISGYYTGALLINTMILAGEYNYVPGNRPVISEILNSMDSISAVNVGMEIEQNAVSEAYNSFMAESKRIVESSVEANEVVLKGPLELVGVNIYDARCYNGYITSRFFFMYLDNGEKKVIRDNCVIKMRDEKTIDTVYRWNRQL